MSSSFDEGHCLERLFGRDDFLTRCWPGQHAVAHGPLDRLGPLGAMPELFDLKLLLETYEDKVRVALADKRDEHSSLQVDAEEAAALHREGMALILNSVERFLPPVQFWLDGLRTELGLPLKCDPRSIVYVSPAGSGNSPHFDANANFVVQIRGTKRWRIAPNHDVPNPTDRWAMNQTELPEELEGYVDAPLPTQLPDDAESFDLVPGSVLFVPRGYWHQTEADEDTLALNFTFGQPTWADLLLTALRTRLLKDPAWRELANGLRAPAKLDALLRQLQREAGALHRTEVVDALDTQPAFLLVPRGFLHVEDGKVIASLGSGEFEIDADVSLHPVLEWIGRQRTPFSLEQVAQHFPALTPGLPALLQTLRSNRLLGRHHCRPTPDRD
jgi:50S ribosomal protein L16 3-hydroxylase